MRLHIANNEKIINRCIYNFELIYPGDNIWIIFPNWLGTDYVDDTPFVIKCKYDSDLFWLWVKDIGKYDKIFIHLLTFESASFVKRISHPSIYWIEWGHDLYNVLLKYKGYKLYSEKDAEFKYGEHRLPAFLSKLRSKYRLYLLQKLFIQAIQKMKFFVPDSMYDEYPLLLKYYPSLDFLEYKNFFYYPIDEVLGSNFQDAFVEGTNIIIGNSGSISGNHEEVFVHLATIKVMDRKIIAPLSYGVKKYIDHIVKRGEKVFGANFVPLLDYMPLEKYNEILKSANIFIYNNYRQEAVGNILVALYLGGKVFLNDDNPLLSFYRKLGLSIFPLSSLQSSKDINPLPQDVVLKNRQILMAVYSHDRQLELIKSNM